MRQKSQLVSPAGFCQGSESPVPTSSKFLDHGSIYFKRGRLTRTFLADRQIALRDERQSRGGSDEIIASPFALDDLYLL